MVAQAMVEAAPGVYALVNGELCVLHASEVRHVVRIFFEALEEPEGARGVTLDLLPREYTAVDGSIQCLPEGHRIFRMCEVRDDCELRYFLEIIEPQSKSRNAGFSILVDACNHHGLDSDAAYYKEYDAYDLAELRQQLAERRRELIRADAYSESAAHRLHAEHDWPDGKENVTWLDGIRGFEFGDWIEIRAQCRPKGAA